MELSEQLELFRYFVLQVDPVYQNGRAPIAGHNERSQLDDGAR